MELRQLECFVGVAEELNFRRASERLHIVQPTISLHIQRLEREIGAPLFDRSTRPVRLTQAGRRFLPEAREVLAAVRRSIHVAREREDERPTFRLGTVTALGERLDWILEYFALRRPDLLVDLRPVPSGERVRQVREGTIDAALVRLGRGEPDLIMTPAWAEPLAVALPQDLEAACGPVVALRDLADLPMRIMPREHNAEFHDRVLAACREAGFDPVMGKPFTSIQDTLAEIGRGTGWTVLYPHAPVASTARVTRLPADPGILVPVHVIGSVRPDAAWKSLLLLEACAYAEERAGLGTPAQPSHDLSPAPSTLVRSAGSR
ncbi:LysR family transcriptional regulator [Kineosporia mesophila]|uniref:LysR family transcriptional regulator n=2 Tax=Kineosporia mesophila TaxID=566012 RepID=A0ABP6ZMA3_9ACTN|nr:LysR family transcriptional regulator [Kineosporia mesophila]